MNIKGIFEFMSWTLIASIIVLIIMKAPYFAKAVGSIGGFAMNEEALYTGSRAA